MWAPWRKKLIRLIEAVQERATLLVDNMQSLSYQERLHALGLTTLAFRRLRGDMIEVWKHLNVYSRDTIPATFRLVDRPIRTSTRHPIQLYINVPKDGTNGIQSNSFYYRVIKTWNELPIEVATAETLDAFKNRFDSYTISKEKRMNCCIQQ